MLFLLNHKTVLDDTTATRSHILKLKCTKFDFDWGSAPDAMGELLYSDPAARFEGT